MLNERTRTRPTCCFPAGTVKILLYLRWHDVGRKMLTAKLFDGCCRFSGAVENKGG